MTLHGRKIILAVTGSIAAYKTPLLVRLLIKSGAEVRVLMTAAAGNFVTPLSLATVSRNPVYSNVNDGAEWNNHVELGRWADLMLIAPCSANSLAKLANGLCDNLVNAVYLSATCPVLIAPAMDEDMWLHPATRNNLNRLRTYGNTVIPVGHGELASGLVGEGRMAEPEEILDFINGFLRDRHYRPLAGLTALVTAGPTYERLDPVRYIGNFSTGKMGIALAQVLARKGARVKLVLGPTTQQVFEPGVDVIRVESAHEMYESCLKVFPEAAISILAAAVADYTPETRSTEKIKKQGDALQIQLKKTEDILATLGAQKRTDQLVVGFALETHQEQQHALEKLERKNADLIVLNSLRDEGAGFGHDTNKVTLVQRNGTLQELPLQSKQEAAAAIVNFILEMRHVEKTV